MLAGSNHPAALDAPVLGLRGWRLSLLPPLVAFLVAGALLSAVAVYGGRDPIDPHTWTSFDSPIYLDIAERGYTSRPCPRAELEQGATACGTFGWFPLYPAAIAPLLELGVAPEGAGLLVSLAFWLALLVVLWNGLLLPTRGRAVVPALALATFAPGAFYFHTVYPSAMAACLLVVALVCLRRERWLWAGVAGSLAAAAYPGATTLALVAGVWLLAIAPAPSLRERMRRIALVCGLTAAGFAAVLLYAELSTGQWNGYFGVQARFRDGFTLPFGNWLDISRPRFEGLGNISLFLAFQSWLTTLLVAIVAVATWLRRREAGAFDWLIVLWAVAFWVIPLSQEVVAYYRTDALLVPIAVAFARLPPLIVGGLATAAAGVSAGMSLAFMQGVLV